MAEILKETIHQTPNGVSKFISSIARIPDLSGFYPTEIGDLGIDFSKINPQGGPQRVSLIFDGEERFVDLSPKGIGVAQLGPNEYLKVVTDHRIRVIDRGASSPSVGIITRPHEYWGETR